MKTSLFLCTALTALLVTGMASAAKKTYVANDVTGDNELPTPVDSANAGKTVRLTYDDVTKKLCGKVEFTTTTFDAAQGVHLHIIKDPAGDGTGPILVTLGKGTGPIIVNTTLTATQETDLAAPDVTVGGKVLSAVYINVHSNAFPNGELRGDLIEDGDAEPEECVEAGTDAGTPPPVTTPTSDAGTSGTTATPAATDDGGCNTTGGSTGSGLAIMAGLGLVLAAASRKRKKA